MYTVHFWQEIDGFPFKKAATKKFLTRFGFKIYLKHCKYDWYSFEGKKPKDYYQV